MSRSRSAAVVVFAALLCLLAADAAWAQAGRINVQFTNADMRIGDRKIGDYKGGFTGWLFVDGKPESLRAIANAVRLHREYGKTGKFHGFIVVNYAKENQANVNQAVRGTGWQIMNDPGGAGLNQNFGVPVDQLPVVTTMDPDLILVWSGQLKEFEVDLAKRLGVDKAPPPIDPTDPDQAVESMEEALRTIMDRGEYTDAVERLAGLDMKMMQDPKVVVAATRIVLMMKMEQQNKSGIERALGKHPKAKNNIRVIIRKVQQTLEAPLPGEAESPGSAPTTPRTTLTRDDLAMRKLDDAETLQLDGKDIEAYEQFKDIAQRYKGTEASTAATQHVTDYEADPEFMKKYNSEVGEEKAQALLRLARSYKQAGRSDLAQKSVAELMEKYPGSNAAAEAKAEGLAK